MMRMHARKSGCWVWKQVAMTQFKVSFMTYQNVATIKWIWFAHKVYRIPGLSLASTQARLRVGRDMRCLVKRDGYFPLMSGRSQTNNKTSLLMTHSFSRWSRSFWLCGSFSLSVSSYGKVQSPWEISSARDKSCRSEFQFHCFAHVATSPMLLFPSLRPSDNYSVWFCPVLTNSNTFIPTQSPFSSTLASIFYVTHFNK